MTAIDQGSHWQGKAAVVTGGARGQGAAVALRLLQAGAHVYVLDSLPLADPAWQGLRTQAESTAQAQGVLTCLALDVAQPSSWQAVASQLQDDGQPLAGLVNNAGITGARSTVTRATLEEWERVMAVNLTGAFLGIRALAPLMQAGGAVVNVSSTVGMTGYYSAAYSTSKWALRGLTGSAALELAAAGIRVNCVCPGVVDTEMIRNHPALVQALQGVIPMGHMATPEQIAEVMFFLLGPGAAYITGADLAVDGGVTGGGIYGPVGRAIGAL